MTTGGVSCIMGTMSEYTTLYEWASEFDSHTIYNADALEELRQFGIDPAIVPTHTVKQQRAAIKARGLGGHIEGEDTDRTFTGYEMTSALARHVTGTDPGAMFMGRGKIHRANLAALKEHDNADYRAMRDWDK